VKNRSRNFKFLVIILVLFLFWIIVAPFLAKNLIVEKSLEKADVIVILSGSSAYIERNQEAVILYKQGIAPKIILTNDGLKGGWNKIEQRNPYFVEKARAELISQGVPVEAIEVLPTFVDGTDEEADLFAKFAREKDLKSVLLVTSAYHSRRTLWTFEKAAAKHNLSIEIGIESPPTGQQTPPPVYWWLSPTGWTSVGEEYVKIVYYWLYY
jgi:uncharacterized SAM-binding protein YcdF (DUF218 family)